MDLTDQANELTRRQIEPHHLYVLIALSELTPPAEVTDDTDEEEAPTQASIAALTDYGQPWVSQVLSDLYLDSSELPRGRGGAPLVRRLERPQRHLRPPHRDRDMYWLTVAADELLTTLFP